MRLPTACGTTTSQLIAALRADEPTLLPDRPHMPNPDALADDDLQLALWICYELHYRGFDEVAAQWEWRPELIALRAKMEQQVLAALRRDVVVPKRKSVAEHLRALVDADEGPALSQHMQQHADRSQFEEFVVHRSIYQLKEADPHSWAIPRLDGPPKIALLEIQFDEYGSGDADRMHSELYRQLLRSIDLDDGYGAYIDSVPGITLAISNVMSLFGLRRQFKGALLGHLAAYEMTSSQPCRRYARGLRRLGGSDAACQFYDEHVTADALHEQLVMHDLCAALVADEPECSDDILFGAAACLLVDNRFAEHVLACWGAGASSLRRTTDDEFVVAG